jgi:hypothetical protein
MNPRTARIIPLAIGLGLCWLAGRGLYQGMELRQTLRNLDAQFAESPDLVKAYDAVHEKLLVSLSNASLALMLIGVAMVLIGIKVLSQKE